FGHRRKVWLFAVGVPREGWRAVGSASLAVQRKLDRRGHRKAAEPVIERSNLYCFTDGQRFADFAGAELLPEPEGQP
ncbi:MAG TPA: hypothetical protein PKE47_03255, partial [Verrucomicrobiota bacterium]|nr:hypothetical protein [Verrucomicrobiota bacterium]